jgi:hypothetical protein
LTIVIVGALGFQAENWIGLRRQRILPFFHIETRDYHNQPQGCQQ